MSISLRILTWNLGLFSWYKYAHYFGSKIRHEYFQKSHGNLIEKQIREINPSICVLQEFFTEDDILSLTKRLKDKFPYYEAVSTWYHAHSIVVLSTEPIEKEKLGNSEFFLFQTCNTSFVPVHLNSFRAEKRLKQVKDILSQTEDREVDCILGDTNFWTMGKEDFFVFRKDKLAYRELTDRFIDTTKGICTTKVHLNFDKIFFKKDSGASNATCIHKDVSGMDHYPVFLDIVP